MALVADDSGNEIKSVQDVLKSDGNDELKFGLLIGLIKVNQVSSKDVVDTLLHLLVGGEFDIENNFIIQKPGNILHMLKLLDDCPHTLQAEIWSVFTAMLKKSRRNLAACTDVGLIGSALRLLSKAEDMSADLIVEMLGVLASYSITVKELRSLFAFLKAKDGKWPRHSVKLISVLRQMPQRSGPDEFFSFPGRKGSHIALPPIKTWPSQNGWSFSCWLRLDPVTGATVEREKPYIYCFRTSKGVGYSAHFVGEALVITAMKVKGKGFQHCVKYEFLPRKWYMVTLVHVYNRWSRSEIRAYVDGQLVSSTDMSWLVSTSDPFDRCYLGSSMDGDAENMFCGQMSAVYLFSEALLPQQIQAAYQLGPGYKSQFRFDNESVASLGDSAARILYDGRLTGSIVFMYNPIACDSQLCLESSPKGNPSYFVHTPHAMMCQEVKAVITHSIHSVLHSLGGIQILFPLFGQLDLPVDHGAGKDCQVDHTTCANLMGLLCDLLKSSSTIQQQLLQSKGFLVIAYLLEKSSKDHITPAVLESFLELTQYLVKLPAGASLLRHLFDYILFNPQLWVHTTVEVQTKLYCYLATEFINDAHIYTNIRRVSAILQTMHSLKYYYWVLSPLDRSGIMPKGLDGPRPSHDEIIKLRFFMLLYLRELIVKGQGILEDELQSMLNYLTTLHEDDNIQDVLELLVELMAQHPASMVPAFDRKNGVSTVFKLLASPKEDIRLLALRLLGFFLMRSTYRRKQDAMTPHNLFSLLAERLMLHTNTISVNTYNVLFEILTERMSLEKPKDLEPESTHRIENSAILKVVATMIRQSKATGEVLEVKKRFLSDLTILCNNNKDNRRTVLQMSVWQDWLFTMAYIYPCNSEQQKITDMVMSLFRMLLHHAIKFEFGGWRVWIDTLAILHSKVAYEDFSMHMSKMYHQYEQQRTDDVVDPSERQQRPISTISGITAEGGKPVPKSTVKISEISDDEAIAIQNGESQQVDEQTKGKQETDKVPVEDDENLEKSAASEKESSDKEQCAKSEQTHEASAKENGSELNTDGRANRRYDEDKGATASEPNSPPPAASAESTASSSPSEYSRHKRSENRRRSSSSAAHSGQNKQVTVHRQFSSASRAGEDRQGRAIFSPGPRAPPFRIPEFRWSYLHQKLLSDLLFAVETDIQVWKSHSTKNVIDFVNASDNHIYVVNVTHMISQLADNLITSCGGLLPLLAAATSPNGEIDILEPNQGLSIEQAVSILQRIMAMTDILVFASSTNFTELEQEKNMPSGGILRQCLRLVCTAAVRNCLECRHRYSRPPSEPPSPGGASVSSASGSKAVNGIDPIQSLIGGSRPSTKNIVENLAGQVAPIKDPEKLLQDMDINRLRAVVYRDVEETKQAEFLALAIVYFTSVLMVSKYRDILEPPTPSMISANIPYTGSTRPSRRESTAWHKLSSSAIPLLPDTGSSSLSTGNSTPLHSDTLGTSINLSSQSDTLSNGSSVPLQPDTVNTSNNVPLQSDTLSNGNSVPLQSNAGSSSQSASNDMPTQSETGSSSQSASTDKPTGSETGSSSQSTSNNMPTQSETECTSQSVSNDMPTQSETGSSSQSVSSGISPQTETDVSSLSVSNSTSPELDSSVSSHSASKSHGDTSVLVTTDHSENNKDSSNKHADNDSHENGSGQMRRNGAESKSDQSHQQNSGERSRILRNSIVCIAEVEKEVGEAGSEDILVQDKGADASSEQEENSSKEGESKVDDTAEDPEKPEESGRESGKDIAKVDDSDEDKEKFTESSEERENRNEDEILKTADDVRKNEKENSWTEKVMDGETEKSEEDENKEEENTADLKQKEAVITEQDHEQSTTPLKEGDAQAEDGTGDATNSQGGSGSRQPAATIADQSGDARSDNSTAADDKENGDDDNVEVSDLANGTSEVSDLANGTSEVDSTESQSESTAVADHTEPETQEQSQEETASNQLPENSTDVQSTEESANVRSKEETVKKQSPEDSASEHSLTPEETANEQSPTETADGQSPRSTAAEAKPVEDETRDVKTMDKKAKPVEDETNDVKTADKKDKPVEDETSDAKTTDKKDRPGNWNESSAVTDSRLEEREEAEGSSNQPIASISVSQKPVEDGSNNESPKPPRLDLTHPDIPDHLHTLPVDGGSLTQRLERALGSVSPLLREVFVDFAPFLSKTLIGSHGQELLIGGLVTLKQSTSVVELVMLLCSQEWQNSLQKHAGLAFIELVNEGRLLAHATRDHIVRVANEAEFILNRMRAEDVQKHADFESLSAQVMLERREEEKLCDHLIKSAKRRDHSLAYRLKDKVINILTNKHGAWGRGADSTNNEFWKLDVWEDDSRRRRRLMRNPLGSTHPQATLKAAIEHGATEDAISQAREAFHAHLTNMRKVQKEITDYTDEELMMEEKDLEPDFSGPVALSTSCRLVAPGVAVKGTMSITKSELYFEMDDEDAENKKTDSLVLAYVDCLHGKWNFSEVRAIFSRRYLLQNVAIEIFMANRTAVMFAFPDHSTVKKVIELLPRVGVGIKYGLPQARRMSLASGKQLFKLSNMTQKWQRREISNFDYIMYLNTIAGRTYNDLNQYHVFPWVLVNYDSEDLDLSTATTYRDLSKPIGALNETRRSYFEERFKTWEHEQIPPFHFGTHYSTAAFTLNWLLRLEPFTTLFLNLQGGKFDHPNRIFASIAQAWKNCQRDTSDVKELVPEFFFLPEMLSNSNRYELGKQEDGSVVSDVELPPWAKTPEDFIRINRQALESEFVSCQLHHWIDLIFGYKQKGPEAVRATNVFYYLTYEGSVNLEDIADPIMKEAVENQIRSFGQTPSQLLTEPHPPRSSLMHLLIEKHQDRRSIINKSPMMFSQNQEDLCMIMKFLSNSPIVHVAANTHPAVPTPSVTTITANHHFAINKWNNAYIPASAASSFSSADSKDSQATPQLPLTMDQLLVLNTGLQRRTLGDNFDERLTATHSSFVITADNRFIFACGFWDKSFRLYFSETAKILQVVFGHYDVVTVVARSECNVNQDCYIATGAKDCTVMVWLFNAKAQAIVGDNGSVENPTPKAVLTGHQAEVTCLGVIAELGIIVSGSKDGPCLVHTLTGDLLRSLDPPNSCKSPKLITISREAFILVTFDKGHVCSFTINGKLQRYMDHKVTLLAQTLSRDGQYMILSGETGVVEVWRTHDFTLLYTYPQCDSSIRSLALTHDHKFLIAGLATGCILVFNIDFNKWHHEYQERYT